MNIDVAIIEIRAGVGGDEAKIWASDLFRMYLKFAEKHGWKTTILSGNILRVSGQNAFNILKSESGVHRVQRIPQTERYGRIHTSTASIVVLPEVGETEIKINPNDLEWQFVHASSHGGQNVQKVATAVRLTHKPTGIIVTCEQERFQVQNRELALELLRTRLWEQEELKKEATVAGYRSVIGRGMRAEKIRTYNYPQSRITDHRLKKSWYNLEAVIDGNLDKIMKDFASSQNSSTRRV